MNTQVQFLENSSSYAKAKCNSKHPHTHILSMPQDLSYSLSLSLSALKLNSLMVWKAGCHFRLVLFISEKVTALK